MSSRGKRILQLSLAKAKEQEENDLPNFPELSPHSWSDDSLFDEHWLPPPASADNDADEDIHERDTSTQDSNEIDVIIDGIMPV